MNMFILAVPHEAINSLFFIPIIFLKKKKMQEQIETV